MSKIMDFREIHYSVRQKVGDAGSISTQNVFPLHSVTPKPPESPYGANLFLLAENRSPIAINGFSALEKAIRLLTGKGPKGGPMGPKKGPKERGPYSLMVHQ